MPASQEASADPAHDSDIPPLGLTVAPASSVAGAGKTGVVVTDVDPKSAAADRGVKQGDVILEVAGKSVANPDDVREAVKAAHADNKKRRSDEGSLRRRLALCRCAARKRLIVAINEQHPCTLPAFAFVHTFHECSDLSHGRKTMLR